MTDSNSVFTRLAYLITPKPELFEKLQIDERHDIRRATTVITAIRDYEESFEGWKSAWRTKAKLNFISDFSELWSQDFASFTATLSPEIFDLWWTIENVNILEIEHSWNPS